MLLWLTLIDRGPSSDRRHHSRALKRFPQVALVYSLNSLRGSTMKKSKRNRRTKAQIHKIRNKALQTILDQGTITLSQLIVGHGEQLEVRDTPSDRHLLRKQLAALDAEGKIQFSRQGRDLVARSSAGLEATSGVVPELASATAPGGVRVQLTVSGLPENPELEAIKAYAGQLEALGQILNDQIARLVRMIQESNV